MFTTSHIVTAIVLAFIIGIGFWAKSKLDAMDRDDELEEDRRDDDDYDDDDDIGDYDTGDYDFPEWDTIARESQEMVLPVDNTDVLMFRTKMDRELRPSLYDDEWFDIQYRDLSAWVAQGQKYLHDWHKESEKLAA